MDRLNSRIRALLREPIFQFFAAGAVIFGIYTLRAEPPADGPGPIVISAREQAAMDAMFQRTWKRPPTADEHRHLLDSRIREEVLAREATAMGLDQDDMIVRRRLAQKVEILTDDLATLQQPADSDLETFLAANADRYRQQIKYSFRQIFLGPNDAGLSQRLAQARAALTAGADPRNLGRPIELPQEVTAGDLDRVARFFGKEFAAALPDLNVDEWSAPVPSAYGAHLVNLGSVTDPRLPDVAEIRDALARDWLEERRKKARDDFYQEIKSGYEIVLEPRTDETDTASGASDAGG